MRVAYSVRYLSRPELEFSVSVMLSVREIVNALWQGDGHQTLIMTDGMAFRLRTSFHWLMKVTGINQTWVVWLQFRRRQKQQEALTLYKMGSYSGMTFTTSLIITISQLILMYVYSTFSKSANLFSSLSIRLRGLIIILGQSQDHMLYRRRGWYRRQISQSTAPQSSSTTYWWASTLALQTGCSN